MGRLTPLKAIRLKCLDCCAGSRKEVRLCPAKDCPLWPFRFGKLPSTDKNSVRGLRTQAQSKPSKSPPEKWGVFEKEGSSEGKVKVLTLPLEGRAK